MKSICRAAVAAALVTAPVALRPAPVAASPLPVKPRLVVLISIDQFRADYLNRFDDLFLPATSGGKVGGFRYLMEQGAYFPDAHHDHLPLATGPGHSIHMTGAPPYKGGIVGNNWYDYAKKKMVYCVQDDDYPLVGTTSRGGISALSLRVTTVGDELKMASGGQAKVFGISLKDRAAVLMSGHLANAAFWFDDSAGRWISSKYYLKDGTLPVWLEALNAKKVPDSYFGRTWIPLTTGAAALRSWTPQGIYANNPSKLGTDFPHVVNGGLTAPGAAFYRAFTTTPFANTFVLDSAEKLIQSEKLGQGTYPSILVINLASNDYIGHAYGPDSPEVMDVTVNTDRQLSKFFNDLDTLVPGGLKATTIVVTADHGAAPNSQAVHDAGLRGGIWTTQDADDAVKAEMVKEFGEGDWIIGYDEPYYWLNRDELAKHNIPLDRAQDAAARGLAKLPGVYAAYAGHNILSGNLPRTDIAHHVTLGYHPSVSGDIAVISAPFFFPSGGNKKGTSHGEPYTYDTHVPLLLAGSGIRPGIYTDRVSTLDIAPTLSFLLHVQEPSGCEGRMLTPAIAAAAPRGR